MGRIFPTKQGAKGSFGVQQPLVHILAVLFIVFVSLGKLLNPSERQVSFSVNEDRFSLLIPFFKIKRNVYIKYLAYMVDTQ